MAKSGHLILSGLLSSYFLLQGPLLLPQGKEELTQHGFIPDSPLRETLVMVQSRSLERLNIPSLSALIRDADVPKQYNLVIFINLAVLRDLQ